MLLSKTQLIDYLDIKSRTETNLFCRCPFCGDSRRSQKKARFSIKDEFPCLFYCFRCHEKGVLNRYTLQLLNIPENIIREFTRLHKHYKPSEAQLEAHRVEKLKFHPKQQVSISKPRNKDKEKLEYLNQRLDTKFTLDDLNRYKIVFSLYDFLNENGIKQCNLPQGWDWEAFDEDHVGFLSRDNQYIIFRDITNTYPSRYFNYKIYKDSSTAKKLYSFNNQVADRKKERFNFVISEGILDLIQASRVLDFPNDSFYFAVCGSNYNTLLNQLIQAKLFPFNLYLILDNDKQQEVKEQFSSNPWFYDISNNVYTLVNEYLKEKDFGVPANKIKEKRLKVPRKAGLELPITFLTC